MSYSVLGFARESSDFDFLVIVRLGVREGGSGKLMPSLLNT
jgi:hypothetical protein